MTMNTLGLGLGARPAMRSRVVAAKSAKAIVGTPVVGKPVQLATRRAAVTVRAAGNPEPIVQAPFKGIKEDLAARGPLYIDDFKQGISPKSLVRDHLLFCRLGPQTETSFPARSVLSTPSPGERSAKRPAPRETRGPDPFRRMVARIARIARSRSIPPTPELDRPTPRHRDARRFPPPKLDRTGNFFFKSTVPCPPPRFIASSIQRLTAVPPLPIFHRRRPSSSSSSRPSRPPSPSAPCSPPPPPACSARPR